jgi:hypothetical protein
MTTAGLPRFSVGKSAIDAVMAPQPQLHTSIHAKKSQKKQPRIVQLTETDESEYVARR